MTVANNKRSRTAMAAPQTNNTDASWCFSAHPHDTVRWALSAWFVSARYIPLRSDGKSSDIMTNMTEAVLIVSIVELLKEIELSLKASLQSHLQMLHGSSWWASLPPTVRGNALNRHRWATAQIGARRAGTAQNIAWLSMGDVMRSLAALDKHDWVACVKAENSRRRQFEHALQGVKAFRDNYLAHPKPHRTTNHELTMLCRSIQRLPTIIRPNEWKEVTTLVAKIESLPPADRSEFFDEAWSFSPQNPNSLCEWLKSRDLARPCSSRLTDKVSPIEAKWRERVVRLCAALDAGGYVFFGREE